MVRREAIQRAERLDGDSFYTEKKQNGAIALGRHTGAWFTGPAHGSFTLRVRVATVGAERKAQLWLTVRGNCYCCRKFTELLRRGSAI